MYYFKVVRKNPIPCTLIAVQGLTGAMGDKGARGEVGRPVSRTGNLTFPDLSLGDLKKLFYSNHAKRLFP